MMKKEQPNIGIQWPLFAYKSLTKVKKFWEKHKKTAEESQILMKGYLMRLGKKKFKPKLYFFKLDNQYTLYYFKKEHDQNPKGKIQLNQYIQINLKQIALKEQKHIAIQISKQINQIIIIRTEQVAYKLYHSEGPEIFEWWNILIKICTINNYDDMYNPLEVLGKGSFATTKVYKVKRLIDGQVYAAKYYYKDSFQTNEHKDKFFVNFVQL